MKITAPCLVAYLCASLLYAATDEDVARTVAYLAALSGRDSPGIEGIAQKTEEQWRNEGPTQYALVMTELCGAISRMTLPEQRQRHMAQKYALMVFFREVAVPYDLEVELLRYVSADLYSAALKTGPTRDEIIEQRRHKASLYVRAWQRLEELTIPNFNFDDLPTMNVDLPPGVSGFSGMDPSGIKDPEQRRIYAKAVEANHQKAETYLTQHTIRQLRPRFARRLTRFIAASYSQEPYAPQELETFLRLIKDETLRSNIRTAMQNSAPQ